jgi:hypothetical protein
MSKEPADKESTAHSEHRVAALIAAIIRSSKDVAPRPSTLTAAVSGCSPSSYATAPRRGQGQERLGKGHEREAGR